MFFRCEPKKSETYQKGMEENQQKKYSFNFNVLDVLEYSFKESTSRDVF